METTSARQRRVEWLLRHRELWQDFPATIAQMSSAHWVRQEQIIERMRAEGLYAQSTRARDVNLIKLLREAKRQHLRDPLAV